MPLYEREPFTLPLIFRPGRALARRRAHDVLEAGTSSAPPPRRSKACVASSERGRSAERSSSTQGAGRSNRCSDRRRTYP